MKFETNDFTFKAKIQKIFLFFIFAVTFIFFLDFYPFISSLFLPPFLFIHSVIIIIITFGDFF